MLKSLTENVNNMQEHLGNGSRKMETLRKSQKGMLQNQNHSNKNEDCI